MEIRGVETRPFVDVKKPNWPSDLKPGGGGGVAFFVADFAAG